MKKVALFGALALALCGSAYAKSSVTLYGSVDAGLGYLDKQTKNYVTGGTLRETRVGIMESEYYSNRFGLKGEEDLGNGTSAIFKLESGFGLSNGKVYGDRLWSRGSMVGLKNNKWGTLVIGRDYNIADLLISDVDPMETSFDLINAGSALGGAIGIRADAVVRYLSPEDIHGFQFGLSYLSGTTRAIHEIQDDGTHEKKYDNGTFSSGLTYTNGPLHLVASYDYSYNRDEGTDEEDGLRTIHTHFDAHQWMFGGTYDLQVVKLYALYGQQINGIFADKGQFNSLGYIPLQTNAAGKTTLQGNLDGYGLRAQTWVVGAHVLLSNTGRLFISYQGNYLKNSRLLDATYKNQGNVFGVAYIQDITKHTMFWAAGGYGWSNNYKNGDKVAKIQSSTAMVGLTHTF